MVQKMLKEMKDRLTVEDPPEAVPPNTGADRTEPMDEEESSKEGVPVFNTSAEYQWYESTIEMSALGDSDEGGSFCISRRRVDEAARFFCQIYTMSYVTQS